MAQRRQVLDTGFLPNFLSGAMGQLEKRREQQRKLEQLFAAALAAKQAKRAFPSAEEQAKQQILSEAEVAGRVPQPMGGYNPQERAAGFPGQVEEAARNRKLAWLQKILPTSGGTMQVLGINPITKEVTPVANVPRGSRTFLTGDQPVVVVDPVTGEQIDAGTVQRGTHVISPQVPLEKTTSVISAESALRSIGEMRQQLADPSALLTRGIPGVEGARELDRLMKNLELEIVTARGGKQLTPSERELIRNVFPNRADAVDAMFRGDPSVISNKLDELETKAQSLIGRVPVKGSTATSSAESIKARLRAKYGR